MSETNAAAVPPPIPVLASRDIPPSDGDRVELKNLAVLAAIMLPPSGPRGGGVLLRCEVVRDGVPSAVVPQPGDYPPTASVHDVVVSGTFAKELLGMSEWRGLRDSGECAIMSSVRIPGISGVARVPDDLDTPEWVDARRARRPENVRAATGFRFSRPVRRTGGR